MLSIKCYGSSSRGNCYLLSKDGSSILLDAGISPNVLLKDGVKISELEGVLVTHEHGDHAKYAESFARRGVNIYTSKHTDKVIFENVIRVPISRRNTLIPHQATNIGAFKVASFELAHDVPNIGFYIQTKEEKLVYITDTYYSQYKFQGLTHIMIECNHSYKILDEQLEKGNLHKRRYVRLKKSHFSLENVIEFLKANDLSLVKEIWLLHLSDKNSNAEEFKRAVMACTGIPTIIADNGCESQSNVI